MNDTFLQLLIFTAKIFLIVLFILLLIAGILALLSKAKEKMRGRIQITNLNQKYNEILEELQREILPKQQLKDFFKRQKAKKKALQKQQKAQPQKNIFVLDFHGDIRASEISALREEVTAVLSVATPDDEVVLRLESAGGMVHAYGLAAAQLLRFKQHRIPLTVCVDKIAASGGYLMACMAKQILAAPFAIIGSVGVIAQLPNFHRLLKEKNIDFEQLTAGQFKRTLTLFGPNTEAAREKLQQELEEVHQLFKNAIAEHREKLDVNKIATGEHWLGTRALELNLVDTLMTSDDYLLEASKSATLFAINYEIKKSFSEKFMRGINTFANKIFNPRWWDE